MTPASFPASIDLDGFIAIEYARVVAAVAMVTGDRDGACDAVQDAILAMLNRPPLAAPHNLAAWLTVVASNRARDIRRSRSAELRAIQRMFVLDRAHSDGPNERALDVRAALLRLPVRQREVCVLFYLEDQSVATIAATMGLASGTVKTHLSRARHSLAIQLAETAPAGQLAWA